VATAAAQTKTNIASAIAQANLNRINQVTPQGSLKYTQDTNADGTPAFNEDGTPRYTQTQTLSADEQAKYDQANKVALALGGLANSNISRVNDAQSKPFTYDGMTPLRDSVGGGNPFKIQGGGGAQAVTGAGDGVQGSLDYSKLTALPGTSDFSGDARRVSDSVYQQAASRLDPRFAQSDSDMRSRLAAQGISENSDAYRRELDNASRDRNDAYNQAEYSAQQAGSAEQSRIFGLALSARQQGKSEADTAGTFHNAAQDQGFGQRLAQADQGMRADAQNVGENNAAQNAYFNEDSANAAFGNNARQSEIEQAAYLRNLPLNDIAALLGTGPGVQSPDFNPVSQVGVAAPDYMGMVNSNYAQAMNQYNQQQAARSQMLGSIFGAAGTVAGAFAKSDRRFKENIRRIGTLANGLATYAFNYIGDKVQRFGVMAQEVLGIIPDAVVYDKNGFMYVDYGKVY
jgi:hypothetical protein